MRFENGEFQLTKDELSRMLFRWTVAGAAFGAFVANGVHLLFKMVWP